MDAPLPAPAFELEHAFKALPALPGFFPVALPQAGLDEAFDVEGVLERFHCIVDIKDPREEEDGRNGLTVLLFQLCKGGCFVHFLRARRTTSSLTM